MKLQNLFFLSLLLFLLWSCSESYVLEESFEIPKQTWNYQDSMLIKVPVTDTKQRYNLYLDVEHSTEFAYQNLYVRINTAFPSGERVADKVSLELADDTGQWHGKCNSQDCTLRIVLQENIYFKEAGEHQISIEQYMRQDALEGVNGLSFKLSKAEKS